MILRTQRLVIDHLILDDAPFILELVNSPGWLTFIGDRQVRTLDDARVYLREGPIDSYATHGFGLYCVRLPQDRQPATPIGICGLIKRDTLADVDIGFALLPAYEGRGYAIEAAQAVLEHGRSDLGLTRIVAISTPDNHRSIKLLEKLGFTFESTVPQNEDVLQLFAIESHSKRRSNQGK